MTKEGGMANPEDAQLRAMPEREKAELTPTAAGPTSGGAQSAPTKLVARVGEQLQRAAGMARKWAPQEAPMARAVSVMTERLEGAGRALQQREGGSSGKALDALTEQVRRYPVPALIGGVALGYLLAKLTASRRSTPE